MDVRRARAYLIMSAQWSSELVSRSSARSGSCARYKLPAIYPWSVMVTDARGLMTYDANEPDLHWHAAIESYERSQTLLAQEVPILRG
jgi:hypothetical protein